MAVAAGAVPSSRSVAGGAVWLEILPVFLSADGILALRPAGGGASWRAPYDGGGDLRQVVARRLASAGLEPVAIHSTSWRQERGAVVLTHLAVLRPPAGEVEGLDPWRVGPRDLARGTALEPPAQIDLEHVVAHALRHLSWLAAEDRAVRNALDGAWRAALRAHRAEPFRLLEGAAAT